MIFESNSAEDTFAFGQKLGREAVPGEIICLDGDLGVGKTVFTQGFAAGLGIDDYVNSPTFNIVKEYEGGRLPLYHFDVYRIGDPSEMEEIGYEDYFYGQGVSIIEWPTDRGATSEGGPLGADPEGSHEGLRLSTHRVLNMG